MSQRGKSDSADLQPAPDGYPIKLVRDRTPQVLNGSGEPGDLFYGPVQRDPMRWLQLKLAEEVGEYLISGEYSELVDVVSVLEALSVAHGRQFSYTTIQATQLHPRGGFREGVMMYGRHAEFDGDGAA